MSTYEAEERYCAHCHALLEKGARYCRSCGASTADSVREFEPSFEDVQCIYGPCPEEYTYTCPRCGYSWKDFLMIYEKEYCIKCGALVEGDVDPLNDPGLFTKPDTGVDISGWDLSDEIDW